MTCIAFKRKDGKYSIIVKERRTDKHGRSLSLFTLKQREADKPEYNGEACKIVEPYKAPKHVIGNWEGERLFDFTKKVSYDQLTRMPTRIMHKILFG